MDLKYDLICLQETHIHLKDQRLLETKQRGVGIYVKSSLESKLRNWL